VTTTRPVLALVCLLALTLAFAPAPLPRTVRRGGGGEDEISNQRFQGKWKIVSWRTVGPDRRLLAEERTAGITAVRVSGDQWQYLQGDGQANTTHELHVSPGRGATAIDWWYNPQGARPPAPTMLGLIRRRGDVVEILALGGVRVDQRPHGFAAPPPGFWLMTLERER
jgi:hypothetical protein